MTDRNLITDEQIAAAGEAVGEALRSEMTDEQIADVVALLAPAGVTVAAGRIPTPGRAA